MGNSSSKPDSREIIPVFKNKYNWILSYPLREYDYINLNKLLVHTTDRNSIDAVEKNFVDLRINCPPVLNIQDIPVHPIASVCSLLNYQLNRNKLNTFPPSRLFIYHNCFFFEDVRSLFSFEVIFKALQRYGFCSEIDYRFGPEHLELKPSAKLYDVAEAYKFMDIFRVPNDLSTIKKMLQYDMPVLVGLVLYMDLNRIVDKLWMPEADDHKIGGTTGLVVGYSDDRQCFFVKFAYGKEFGSSGYILVPYDYIADASLTPELFYLDLKKNRIEGFLNQRRETRKMETSMNSNTKNYNSLQSLF